MGQISIQRRNGIPVGFSVYLGVDGDGRKLRRFFTHRKDAETFLKERENTPLPIGELWDRRSEILFNLDRLRNSGTSLTDVVSQFLNQQQHDPGKGLVEVIEEFLSEKKRIGRSMLYEKTMRFCLTRFATHFETNQPIRDITREEIVSYVYEKNHHLEPISKRAILTNLNVLFNYARKRDYIVTNPVGKIDRPTVPFKKPHVLTPDHFGKLLHRCLRRKWADRLTVFVLVGFCGIRIEEASRLKWSNIDLKRNIVEVPATVAKKASFRNNPIPPNAREWLDAIQDKRRTGPIISPTWRTRIRTAITYAKIDYGQNAIRHSFCSYALGASWPLSLVIEYMGHGGSSSMIYSHYRNVVSPEDSRRWFELTPNDTSPIHQAPLPRPT